MTTFISLTAKFITKLHVWLKIIAEYVLALSLSRSLSRILKCRKVSFVLTIPNIHAMPCRPVSIEQTLAFGLLQPTRFQVSNNNVICAPNDVVLFQTFFRC